MYYKLVTEERKPKRIRDPLHQFVYLSPYEQDIIDTWPFKRLRFINQLGLTSLVYPGAEHKRFEHSIGTMELATKLYDLLYSKNRDLFLKGKDDIGLFENEEEVKRYKQILRISCLVHDIGHPPFSHGAEDVWGCKHEVFSSKIILSKLKKIIEEKCPDELKIKAKEISYVATGEPKDQSKDGRLSFINELLTGDLGVDRIDYLARDSLHTGVSYGVFDYHRLIDTLMIHEDRVEGKPILCLDDGGIHAAEGLLIARYFMFAQVYYHKVRTAYDLHLKQYMIEFLRSAKEDGIDYTKVDNYIKLTDFTILDKMMKDYREYPKDKSNIRLKSARLILDRKHHKMIKEVNGDLLKIRDNTEIAYDRIIKAIGQIYNEELNNGTILWDVSKKRIDNFEKTNFRICEDGKLTFISAHSILLETLKKIDLFRVYLDRESKIGTNLKKIIETEVEGYR